MFGTCFGHIVNMIVTCCGHIKRQAKGIVQIMVELVMISAAYVDWKAFQSCWSCIQKKYWKNIEKISWFENICFVRAWKFTRAVIGYQVSGALFFLSYQNLKFFRGINLTTWSHERSSNFGKTWKNVTWYVVKNFVGAIYWWVFEQSLNSSRCTKLRSIDRASSSFLF